MNKRDFLRNLGVAALGLVTGLPFIKSRKAEAAPEPFEFAQTPEPDPDDPTGLHAWANGYRDSEEYPDETT